MRLIFILTTYMLVMGILLVSCNLPGWGNPQSGSPTSMLPIPSIPATITPTPYQPVAATATSLPTLAPDLSIWIEPAIPALLIDAFALTGSDLRQAGSAGDGAVFGMQSSAGNGMTRLASSSWVYTLVAPFPTVIDEVSLEALRQAWQGGQQPPFNGEPILVAPATRIIMEPILGAAGEVVQDVEPGSLLETAWRAGKSWAIVPFEALEPRWKVIRIDGKSPLERSFSSSGYPLVAGFHLDVPFFLDEEYRAVLDKNGVLDKLPATNRDAEMMTVLVMTGVTALVRATAWTMETRGITFPGQDIGDLLRNADITHISNEVSFNPDCPDPDPNPNNLRFCSDPDYFELLTSIGTDVIELSGNHLNDWGAPALSYSLDLYRDHKIGTFAGGENLEESFRPLVVTDHGNRIAFLGCNSAGPMGVWAGASSPGAAPCGDYEWLLSQVNELRAGGAVPVVTFQYLESYIHRPWPSQMADFRAAAEAGAAIVSGSQAHFPQIYEFHSGGLIHYGLGNLFFDQINVPGLGEGTRWEFIDRHVVYAGRHISTEVFTAYLEDWARPRWMTPQERMSFLELIFDQGG